MVFSWEWRDDEGNWNAYEPEDNAFVESKFQKLGEKGVFSSAEFSWNTDHNSIYVINFRKSTQRNVETGISRDIRRVEAEATWEEYGWQWWSDDCKWAPYDTKDVELLENAYGTGCTTFSTRDLSFNKESVYLIDVSPYPIDKKLLFFQAPKSLFL